MPTFRQLRGALVAVWLGLCATAFAAAPSPITVTTTSVAGLAGSTVKPSFSLDVDGFFFESFDLSLRFTNPVLSFDLGSSRVLYNGNLLPWDGLPNYNDNGIGPVTIGDNTRFQFSTFSLGLANFSGALVLQPAFKILEAAPLGPTAIAISGSIGSDPQGFERFFDSSATVTVSAVPEPEVWLLWLGGIGLLAWTRKRRSAQHPTA